MCVFVCAHACACVYWHVWGYSFSYSKSEMSRRRKGQRLGKQRGREGNHRRRGKQFLWQSAELPGRRFNVKLQNRRKGQRRRRKRKREVLFKEATNGLARWCGSLSLTVVCHSTHSESGFGCSCCWQTSSLQSHQIDCTVTNCFSVVFFKATNKLHMLLLQNGWTDSASTCHMFKISNKDHKKHKTGC